MQKAIASFLGNAVGDAIGAHTEFICFDSKRNVIEENWKSLISWADKNNHTRTLYGVITDDCSMARCLADSLLSNQGNFNPVDIRLRFLLWWNTGYCNGSQDQRSFGLGGNISQGFNTFFSNGRKPYVFDIEKQKLGNINGNGSIMRLGTIPVAFHDDIEKGQEIAALQSLTTHNGEEAAECCRLLTFLVIKLLNYEGNNPKEDIFEKELKNFKTHCISVQHLANSQQENDISNYHPNFNRSEKDRFWNWKDEKLQVSPTRVQQQPTYFGSYCMDGAYVALHIAYHSKNQSEAIFKAVNWGGDSDSIAAVVGYITGAMYGLQQEIWDLYTKKMVDHDNYTQLIKALRLYEKQYPNDLPTFNDKNMDSDKDYYLKQFIQKQKEWYGIQDDEKQQPMNKMEVEVEQNENSQSQNTKKIIVSQQINPKQIDKDDDIQDNDDISHDSTQISSQQTESTNHQK